MESDFAWWIDQIVPESQLGRRLDHYGCFPTKEMAEEKISQLKQLPAFKGERFVPSKQIANEQERIRMTKMRDEWLKTRAQP